MKSPKQSKGPPLRNIRLTVEYDGTAYFGWQVQDGRKTVQGELVRALQEILAKKVTLLGSGRTDAGVHALAQVANFQTTSRLPLAKWPLAINAHLPEDIRVVAAADAPIDFHSQFGAKEKTYRYTVLNRETASPLRRHFVHLVRPPLDTGKMKEAAAVLQGTHDFRAFGSEMEGKERTIRTLYRISVERVGDEIRFDFTGEGFLYNQVRAMVGTLLEVGRGKQPPGWVKIVLDGKDRTKAGANVPAKGLCLLEVRYDEVARPR